MSIYGDDERRAGWFVKNWRALVSELISTALLVLFGCLTCMTGESALVNPALGFGFVVLANAMAFGAVSGAHMNPAVSLAAAIAGNLSWALAAAYSVMQCVGATLGFLLLWTLAGNVVAQPKDGGPMPGITVPASGVGVAGAIVVEALLTGMLLLAVAALWAAHDPRHPDHTGPLKLGLVVSALIFAGGPLTGASLNPARSLGPAIVHQQWTNHYVYWVGPLGGAALAMLLSRALAPPARAPRDTPAASPALPEELPLHDK